MENVIFIIITLVFLTILAVFIFKQSSGTAYLEQSYAKQISLLIDSAKPGTSIYLDISEGKSEWFDKNFDKSVIVNNNLITVRLSGKSEYSYSFFNDVNPKIEVYPKGEVLILIES